MAKGTLAEPKTSDGTSAWEKYVEKWPWKTTEYEIIKNLPSSILKSFIRIKNQEPELVSEYPSGTKFKILSDKTKNLSIKDFPSRGRTTSALCAEVMIGKEKGYLPIRIIKKPTQTSSRVAKGAVAQKQILGGLIRLNEKRKALIDSGQPSKPEFGYVTELSTAAVGSQKTDVKLKVKGVEINVEVKNNEVFAQNSANFAIYDRTYARYAIRTARNTEGSLEIDGYARLLRGKKETDTLTFEDMIDDIRKDKSKLQYGFIGDEGVTSKTGSIPSSDFSADSGDSTVLGYIKDKILAKFRKSKDDYFAVVQRDDIYMFFVGTGENVLELPDFPTPTSCKFETYGGFKPTIDEALPGKGKMRVKIMLKISTSKESKL
jgi:hypothetical protein